MKKGIRKGVLFSSLAITSAIGTLAGYKLWTVENVPYAYRQSFLDVIDYVAGKNLFGRSKSLQ